MRNAMKNKTRFQNSTLIALSCLALTTLACAKSDSLGEVGRKDGGAGGTGSGGNNCQYPSDSHLNAFGDAVWSWRFHWQDVNLAATCATWGADAKVILEVDVPANPSDSGTTLPTCALDSLSTGAGSKCAMANAWRFEAVCTDGQLMAELPSSNIFHGYYHVESTAYPNSPRHLVSQDIHCSRDLYLPTGIGSPPAITSDGGVDATCYGPTSNLEWSTGAGLVKGCACDPASDKAQCVSAGGIRHLISCAQGAWLIDSMSPCDDIDGPPPPPLDGGLDQAPLDSASDGTSSDGTSSDGTSSDDSGSCQAPNVWRYQNPGCGAEVHPVCGSSDQDAGVAFACGCDGETLLGFDYFKQPWSSRGVCPQACYSPTHNFAVADLAGQIKGCACNPATDATQCVFSAGWAGMRTIACVAGKWQLDTSTTCTVVDGGTVAVDGGSRG
jgi:hypothetical protein